MTFGIRAYEPRVLLFQTGHHRIFIMIFLGDVSNNEILSALRGDLYEYMVEVSCFGSLYIS